MILCDISYIVIYPSVEDVIYRNLTFVFLVGFTGAFPQVQSGGREAVVPYLFSPVPFILAWLVFRVIARPALTSGVRAYVLKKRKELLAYAIASPGIIRDVALAFGPCQSDWNNGRIVARYGIILGGALALLYSVLLLPGAANQINTPFHAKLNMHSMLLYL